MSKSIKSEIRSSFQREALPYYVLNYQKEFASAFSEGKDAVENMICNIWESVVKEVYNKEYNDFPLEADSEIFPIDERKGKEKNIYILGLERINHFATYFAIVSDMKKSARLFLAEFDSNNMASYTFAVELKKYGDSFKRINYGTLLIDNDVLRPVPEEDEPEAFINLIMDVL